MPGSFRKSKVAATYTRQQLNRPRPPPPGETKHDPATSAMPQICLFGRIMIWKTRCSPSSWQQGKRLKGSHLAKQTFNCPGSRVSPCSRPPSMRVAVKGKGRKSPAVQLSCGMRPRCGVSEFRRGTLCRRKTAGDHCCRTFTSITRLPTFGMM